MSSPTSLLIDSIKARKTCPACDRGTREGQDGPEKWFQDRAVFSCGAVFGVRDNAIVAAVACADRSALAAELWTISATGRGRAICLSPANDEHGAVTELILALAAAATAAGFDPMTICEIIRDEMQAISRAAGEVKP